MIKVDYGQNCYSCGRFVGQRRRMEYGDNVNNGQDSNLNGNRNLIVLN